MCSIGDAALCVFGAPVAREDPCGDALRAARKLAARLSSELAEIDSQRPERVLASSSALDRAAAAEADAWSVTEEAVLRGRLGPTQLAHPELQIP